MYDSEFPWQFFYGEFYFILAILMVVFVYYIVLHSIECYSYEFMYFGQNACACVTFYDL